MKGGNKEKKKMKTTTREIDSKTNLRMKNPTYLRNQSSVGGTDMVHVHQAKKKKKNAPNQGRNKFDETAKQEGQYSLSTDTQYARHTYTRDTRRETQFSEKWSGVECGVWMKEL